MRETKRAEDKEKDKEKTRKRGGESREISGGLRFSFRMDCAELTAADRMADNKGLLLMMTAFDDGSFWGTRLEKLQLRIIR